MKQIQLTAFAIASIFLLNCSDVKKDGQIGNPQNQFTTAAEAAGVAKQDMLEAAEKVHFGIDKEKLRASSPGVPIASYDVIWGALLKADSNTSPEAVIGLQKATIVPLVKGNEVVTVVFLKHNDQGYSITALGEKQFSSELDAIRTNVDTIKTTVRIYEVPNLQAIIYAVPKDTRTAYYTSYNNNSIKRTMNAKELIELLVVDAVEFQKRFGEELKKRPLVR